MTQIATTRYSVGDKVQAISDPTKIGIIEEIGARMAGVQYYDVFWGGLEGTTTVPEDHLQDHSKLGKPVENLLDGMIGGFHDFVRLITHSRLNREEPLKDHFYAFNASRTKFFPYQFKPLLKFLDSPDRRILIADEVGLGKTIESGLILTELEARETIQRVLVVCPAALRTKWRLELRTRFGQDFRILHRNELNEFLEDYEESSETTRLKGIVSYESMRNQKVLDKLALLKPDFDLVIMDEAHHMRNPGRLTHRLGKLLSDCTLASGALVFLTATPIHLGNQNLHALLNILDEQRFPDKSTSERQFKSNEPIITAQRYLAQTDPPYEAVEKELSHASRSPWLSGNPLLAVVCDQVSRLKNENLMDHDRRAIVVDVHRNLSELNLLGHIFTRTRKRDAHTNQAKRKPFSVEVRFTDIEMRFYRAVSGYVRDSAERENSNGVIVQWMVNMPQRRMASCIPAMVSYYREKLSVGHFESDDEIEDFSEELALLDEEWEDSPDISYFVDSQKVLTRIVSSWPIDAPDTKYEKLFEILQQLRNTEGGRCKIIIFSFFKATLKYLQQRLGGSGFRSVTIHGDVPSEERPSLIERFRNDPACEVLLSSRVGSEGLDFQFCHAMVNYDLPWNPMEVEQRIGRLDRIGQESEVINIYNLWIENTIESRILKRLYERVRIFEESIGDLELILGQTVALLNKEVFSRRLTAEEERERAEIAALAVEKEQRELRNLEENSAKFLGTDDFFKKEVDNIIRKKRYMTPTQLRYYFEDFIRHFCPKTVIRESRVRSGVFTLFPDRELENCIRERKAATRLARFFQADSKSGIDVTFESDIAYDLPHIEFLSVTHSLLRVAVEAFESQRGKLVNASRLQLSSATIPSGNYFYFVYRVLLNAAKKTTHLELLVCDESGTDCCPPDMREEFLGELLEFGKDCKTVLKPDYKKSLKAVASIVNNRILQRVRQLEEDARRHNDSLIERQMASITESYNRKLHSLEMSILDVSPKNAERYIPMQKGKIRKATEELAQRIRDLESRKKVGIEFNELAAGILEIQAHSN